MLSIVGRSAGRGARSVDGSIGQPHSSVRVPRCSRRRSVSLPLCSGWPTGHPLAGHGWWPVSRLGLRNATYRPGRSMSVCGGHRGGHVHSRSPSMRSAATARRRPTIRDSGVGGYQLLVESLLPVVHDPNSREGREALNLVEPRRIGHDRTVPAAAGRRCELLEPVRAEKSADSGAAGGISGGGPVRVSGLAGLDRGRACQSLAAL